MKIQIVIAVLSVILLPSGGLAAEAGTDSAAYSGPAWSPYLVGALIGVLSMFTFYFSNKPLGASTAYARVAGMLGTLVAPKHTQSLKYYQENKPMIDWEVMLVFGVVLGAFLSAWQGNELTGEWLPKMWEARFGEDTVGLRWLAALAGGGLMAFGAGLAGGCTSGHGISGTMQLSVGSWIAVVCFFASGIATAMLMFRL
jgi:uncharacterized membrane protein YedE/YeeE